MDPRYQYKATFNLLILLVGFTLIIVILPVDLAQYIILPGFFADGTLSLGIIDMWRIPCLIAFIVLVIF